MNAINPDHYKNNGPFECIELSRNYPSDWGQVIQYVWRHERKNGLEDLRKALWFARDAYDNDIPSMPIMYIETSRVQLRLLEDCDHAHAAEVWNAFERFDNKGIVDALERLIEREERA